MRPLPDPLGDDFLTYFLPLTQGYVARVDWKDRIRIRSRPWRAFPTPSGTVYAIGCEYDPAAGKSKDIFLHRWLMDAPSGLDVDHINHDGLDNRRRNFRLATRGQNIANMKRDGRLRTNKHGYRGVHFMRGGFYGHITVNKRQIYSKKCETPIEAARAWDVLAVQHYGQFIELNFPAEVQAA